MKKKEKLLFVCMANVDRSPTAEWHFKKEYDTKSCGIAYYAATPITEELIDWADKIFCMEIHHTWKVKEMKPEAEYKLINLDIDDVYMRDSQTLIDKLEEKVRKYL